MTLFRELELDHPRMHTIVKLCAQDECNPRWEITASTTGGNRLDFDGDSGDHLMDVVDELLAEPTVIAHLSVILWLPQ